MIVSYQMQNAVNQKLVEAILQAEVCCAGLLFSSLNRYDDIAEEVWRNIIKLAFPHGKGDNVGRPFSVQILFIQGFNLLIINEQDG